MTAAKEPTEGLGALAAALARAQGSFKTITRSKEVTVTTSKGSYKFSYAPLDEIMAAVREPLAENGLVVVQLIDDGDLITSLIHTPGAILSGRVEIPRDGNIQQFGSAITYLRRYAIQALLGIVAEEDDDGNGAAGNIAVATPRGARRPAAPARQDADPYADMMAEAATIFQEDSPYNGPSGSETGGAAPGGDSPRCEVCGAPYKGKPGDYWHRAGDGTIHRPAGQRRPNA